MLPAVTPEHRVCALPAVRLSPVPFTLTDQPVSLSGRGRCWKQRRHRGGRLSRHPSRPSTSRRLLCGCPALACALAVGWPWAGLSLAHACAGKAGGKGRGSRRPSWMSPLGTGFSTEASGPCVSTDGGWVPTARTLPRRVEGSAAGDRGSRGSVTGPPSAGHTPSCRRDPAACRPRQSREREWRGQSPGGCGLAL